MFSEQSIATKSLMIDLYSHKGLQGTFCKHKSWPFCFHHRINQPIYDVIMAIYRCITCKQE